MLFVKLKTTLMSGFFILLILPISNVFANSDPDLIINICRPRSIVRMNHTPDLVVDSVVMGGIPNGSKLTKIIPYGADFVLLTKANPLMMRFKDDIILKGHVNAADTTYSILKAKVNLAQSIVALFTGVIGESIRQNYEEGSSNYWELEFVDEQKYKNLCDVE